jgi:hypothetical protein
MRAAAQNHQIFCSFIWTSRAGMQAGAGGMASRAASGRAGPPAGLLRRGSSVYHALMDYSFKGATLQSDLTSAGALPPELRAALFRAAEAGDLDGVKSLVIAAQLRGVSAPALAAAADDEGMTALHWAARGGHTALARFLIHVRPCPPPLRCCSQNP